jgi:hypothetical protein
MWRRIKDRLKSAAAVTDAAPVTPDFELAARLAAYAERLGSNSPDRWPAVDDQVRQRSYVDPLGLDGWLAIRPTDVDVLCALCPDPMLAYALVRMHPNGYVREAALKRLTNAAATLEQVLPVVILRSSDWVPQIRALAICSLDRLRQELPSEVLVRSASQSIGACSPIRWSYISVGWGRRDCAIVRWSSASFWRLSIVRRGTSRSWSSLTSAATQASLTLNSLTPCCRWQTTPTTRTGHRDEQVQKLPAGVVTFLMEVDPFPLGHKVARRTTNGCKMLRFDKHASHEIPLASALDFGGAFEDGEGLTRPSPIHHPIPPLWRQLAPIATVTGRQETRGTASVAFPQLSPEGLPGIRNAFALARLRFDRTTKEDASR